MKIAARRAAALRADERALAQIFAENPSKCITSVDNATTAG
jgi:hypothetical protein